MMLGTLHPPICLGTLHPPNLPPSHFAPSHVIPVAICGISQYKRKAAGTIKMTHQLRARMVHIAKWERLILPLLLLLAVVQIHLASTSDCTHPAGCTFYKFMLVGSGNTPTSMTYTTIASSSVVRACLGANHALWLDIAGSLHATGTGPAGGTGTDGAYTDSTPLGITGTPVQLCCGYDHSIIITSDGKAWTAGSNGKSQLGDGTTTASNTFMDIGYTDAIGCAAGKLSSVVIRSGGSAEVFGSNSQGVLGAGGASTISTPLVSSVSSVAHVEFGSTHSVWRTTSGAVYVTGSNFNGQSGLGSGTTTYYSPTEVTLASGVAHMIIAGDQTSFIVTDTGEIIGSGSHGDGQGGFGSSDLSERNTFEAVSGSPFSGTVSSSCAGYRLTAIVRSGHLYVTGRLGGGNIHEFTRIVDMPVNDYVYDVMCSKAYANGAGFLAAAPISPWPTPTVTPTISESASNTPSVSVSPSVTPSNSASSSVSASVTSTVTSTTTVTPSVSPAVVHDIVTLNFDSAAMTAASTGATNVVDMCTCHETVVFVNSAGEVGGFGRNQFGQLGVGDKDEHPSVVMSVAFGSGSQKAVSVDCGLFHVLVRDESGNVWGAGRNDGHQMGLGTSTSDVVSFTQLSGWSGGAVHVSAGRAQSYVFTDSGAMYVAGLNDRGVLFTESVTVSSSSNVFIEVTDVDGISDVVYADYRAFMRLANGTMYGVGSDGGSFGIGTAGELHDSPVLVWDSEFANPIVDVSVSQQSSLAMDSSGLLFGSGMCNSYYGASCPSHAQYGAVDTWEYVPKPAGCGMPRRFELCSSPSLLVCEDGRLYGAGAIAGSTESDWTLLSAVTGEVEHVGCLTSTSVAVTVRGTLPTASATPPVAPSSSNTRTVSHSPSASTSASQSGTSSGTASETVTTTTTVSSTVSGSVTPTSSVTPSMSPTTGSSSSASTTPSLSASKSVSGSGTASVSESLSASETVSSSLSPSMSKSVSGTSSRSLTATGSPSVSGTPSRSVTVSVTPSGSASSSASGSRTASLSASSSSGASSDPSPSSSISPTDSPSCTPSVSLSSSRTLSSSPSVSSSESRSSSVSMSSTSSVSRSASSTSDVTPSSSAVMTPSSTSSASASGSRTATSSASASASVSQSNSRTSSVSFSPSASRSTGTSPDPTPSSTPTASRTASETPSVSLSSSKTPSQTSTTSSTQTPSSSSTSDVTPSPSAVMTPSSTSSASASGSRTATSSASASVSVSRSSSMTSSVSFSPSASRSSGTSPDPTPSSSPTASRTASETPSVSLSSSKTPSQTSTTSSTQTPSSSSTSNVSPSSTGTPSRSATKSITGTSSHTNTQSMSATTSASSSRAVSPSPTASFSTSPSSTSSATQTSAVSDSAMPTGTPSGSPSSSLSLSVTATVSRSESASRTMPPTVTSTASSFSTASVSSLATPSASVTTSASETAAVSRSATMTATVSPQTAFVEIVDLAHRATAIAGSNAGQIAIEAVMLEPITDFDMSCTVSIGLVTVTIGIDKIEYPGFDTNCDGSTSECHVSWDPTRDPTVVANVEYLVPSSISSQRGQLRCTLDSTSQTHLPLIIEEEFPIEHNSGVNFDVTSSPSVECGGETVFEGELHVVGPSDLSPGFLKEGIILVAALENDLGTPVTNRDTAFQAVSTDSNLVDCVIVEDGAEIMCSVPENINSVEAGATLMVYTTIATLSELVEPVWVRYSYLHEIGSTTMQISNLSIPLVQEMLLPRPSSLICSDIDDSSLTLQWQPAVGEAACLPSISDAFSYDVYIEDNGDMVLLDTVAEKLDILVDNLGSNQEYSFSVRTRYKEFVSEFATGSCTTESVPGIEDVAVSLETISGTNLVAGGDPATLQVELRNAGTILASSITIRANGDPGLDIVLNKGLLPSTGVQCLETSSSYIIGVDNSTYETYVQRSSGPISCVAAGINSLIFEFKVAVSPSAFQSVLEMYVEVYSPTETPGHGDNNIVKVPFSVSLEADVDLLNVETSTPSNRRLLESGGSWSPELYWISYTLVNRGPSTMHPLLNTTVEPRILTSRPARIRGRAMTDLTGWQCRSSMMRQSMDAICDNTIGEDAVPSDECLTWNVCDSGHITEDCISPSSTVQGCGTADGTDVMALPWLPGLEMTVRFEFVLLNHTGLASRDTIEVALIAEEKLLDEHSPTLNIPPSRPSNIQCGSVGTDFIEILVSARNEVDVVYEVVHDRSAGTLEYGFERACSLNGSSSCILEPLYPGTEYTISARATKTVSSGTRVIHSEFMDPIRCSTVHEMSPPSGTDLVGARFSSLADRILLTFSADTDMGNTCRSSDTNILHCEDVVVSSILEQLGDSPVCDFAAGSSLSIVLGPNSTITFGAPMELLNECIRTVDGNEAVSGNVPLRVSNDNQLRPRARISGLQTISAHEIEIRATGLTSSTNGRRAGWTWSVVDPADLSGDETSDALFTSLSLANFLASQNSPTIRIPATMVPPGATFVLELTVENFLGVSDSVQLPITRSAFDIPSIAFAANAPSGRPSAGTLPLSAVVKRSFEVATQTTPLFYRWSADSENAIANDALMSAVLESNVDNGLSTLQFPISMFAPGNEIAVELVVCYANALCLPSHWPDLPGSCACGSSTERVTVLPEIAYAVISGGEQRRIPAGKTIPLEIEIVDENCPGGSMCETSFMWTCERIDTMEEEIPMSCTGAMLTGFIASEMSMDITMLSPGTYSFKAVYTNTNYSLEVVKMTTIIVEELPIPVVEIVPQSVFDPSAVSVHKTVGFTIESDSTQLRYMWEVQTDDVRFDASKVTGQRAKDMTIPKETLRPGYEYTVTGFAWAATIGTAKPSDGFGSASISIEANSPPVLGTCKSSQSTVMALEEVEIICSGWIDSLEPLSYSFSVANDPEDASRDITLQGKGPSPTYTGSFSNFANGPLTKNIRATVYDSAGSSVSVMVTIQVLPQAETQSAEDVSQTLVDKLERAGLDNNEEEKKHVVHNMVATFLSFADQQNHTGANNGFPEEHTSFLRSQAMELLNKPGETVTQSTLLRDVLSVAPPRDSSTIDDVKRVLDDMVAGSGQDTPSQQVQQAIFDSVAVIGQQEPEKAADSASKMNRQIRRSLLVGETTPKIETSFMSSYSARLRAGSNASAETSTSLKMYLLAVTGTQNSGTQAGFDVLPPVDISTISDTYSFSVIQYSNSPYPPSNDTTLLSDTYSLEITDDDDNDINGRIGELTDPLILRIPVTDETVRDASKVRCVQYSDSWATSNCTTAVDLDGSMPVVICSCHEFPSPIVAVATTDSTSSGMSVRTLAIIIAGCVGFTILVIGGIILAYRSKVTPSIRTVPLASITPAPIQQPPITSRSVLPTFTPIGGPKNSNLTGYCTVNMGNV